MLAGVLWASVGTLFVRRWPFRQTGGNADARHVLEAVLDVLIPDGEFPGHRASHVLDRFASDAPDLFDHRQGRRWIDHLDRAARSSGGASFTDLDVSSRHKVLLELEGSGDRLFATFRDSAMRLHYSHAAIWRALRFPNAPQPTGFMDYARAPRRG